MIYGSVCSGIEAASVAWKPLGWKAQFLSEIEKFPSAVLAHHYRTVPNLGDMTKFKEWPDAIINVLVGGTPCQSFSIAGLRKGLDDPRGNLMLTYLAIAARYRPEWLVWENVPGVLSSNGGRDFGTFLGGLGQLGYGFAYRVLDAVYFGVPQFRRRVFVVAHYGEWRRAAAVLFERASLSGSGEAIRGRLRGRGKDRLGCLSTKIAYDRQDLDILIYDYERMTVRLPTILECERAQGFPDGYTDLKKESPFSSMGISGRERIAYGPRYKALGNSMAVPCMAWIGERIAAVEKIKEVA